MNDERLFDDLPRPHPRVERRIRILKHDLHLPPRCPQLATRDKREDILAAKADLARGRLDQPQQAAAGRRLAAAGLADQAERLALFDREAHVIDRGDTRALAEQPARRGRTA